MHDCCDVAQKVPRTVLTELTEFACLPASARALEGAASDSEDADGEQSESGISGSWDLVVV